jgi:hypothetical protein
MALAGTPYKMRGTMSAFDVVFNIWMTLAAVLVFLKVKKLITWDWGIVLAPVVVAILIKGYLLFANHA